MTTTTKKLSKQDQQTIDTIVDVVTTAATAAAPLAGEFAPEVIAAIAGTKALVSYLEQLGQGDAVREALDATLAAGRTTNDAALAAKYAEHGEKLQAAAARIAGSSLPSDPETAAAIRTLLSFHDVEHPDPLPAPEEPAIVAGDPAEPDAAT